MFAPVIPFDIFLELLENFTSGCRRAHHADKFFFLNGNIDGELYARSNNKCYKLQNNLYGLKQSLHLLHEKLNCGFRRFVFTKFKLFESVSKLVYEIVK